MKKIIILSISVLCAQGAIAQKQEQDSIKNVQLNQVVISGNKFAEKKKNIVQKIDVISQKEISQMNAQNMADVLINTGQVFVQKSQQGGGSPVIRGFEASRIQLNVDGIRMNNAIYRAGHLQNIITVDHNALEQVEVLNGPASTIHGSDALGGVIVLKTKDAKFGKTKHLELTGANALVRYSSANHEKTGNIGIHLGMNKFASYTNITFSDFGDLIQGKNGVDSIMNLWKKPFIVERINNADTMLANADPYKQVSTAYKQIDILQKFSFAPSKNIRHGINFQYSTSSNIPRYDRLTETSGGIAKNAEWYYGPQTRTLLAYKFDAVNLKGFFNDLTATLSHQYVNESRHNRGYKKTALNHRDEKINVVGYSVALRHKDKQNELTIGTDGQLNNLKSTAFKEDILSGIETNIDTRYPDGKNNMNLFGLFAQHTLKLDEGKVIVNDGLRFNYTTLHSTLVDTSIQFQLPFSDLKQKNNSLTGNLGIAYMPSSDLRMTLNYSTGFRSPNFDDMTKVFESVTGQRLIVPNVNLKSEITQNFEAGFQYNDGKLELNAYGFYTLLKNVIVTDKFSLNGKDSTLYDGQLTAVYASQNKSKAFIYGGGISFIYRPLIHFSMSGSTNYTFGRYNSDSVLIPLDHIPPVTGRLGIKYDHKKWYGEFYSIYNGKKRLMDYNPNGEDNIQYSTPSGTPSWFTVNFRAGVSVEKHTQIQLGIENILDKNYRYFASGMSAAGRNLIVAVRYNF
jgi:hemoglobin/transferrin/lactoferrin receptor protein